MNLTTHIAKHIRDVHFGGNWTASNLKENLEHVDWKQATAQVHSFNTIATLVYHMNYFIRAILKVLKGGPLDSKDVYSFDHPPIHTEEDWKKLKDESFHDAEEFAALIEQFPESKLFEPFVDPKYGSYYRNIHGIIEHCHYHLGQIVLIKKLLSMPDHKNDVH